MVKTATVKQKVLFDDNDEDQNDESLPIKKDALAINEKYAQRYDTWRSKEEMQKRNKNTHNKTIPRNFSLITFHSSKRQIRRCRWRIGEHGRKRR